MADRPVAGRGRPAVSVVLVRELPAQVTGSGCCGKLAADDFAGRQEAFNESLRIQQRFGVFHRAVRSFFSEEQVSIVTVDPRNQLYLIAKLWRDVFVYRPGIKDGLKSMFQFFAPPAVIVNGRVLTRRGIDLQPDELCHYVTEIGKRT